jgi:hypothetical protein
MPSVNLIPSGRHTTAKGETMAKKKELTAREMGSRGGTARAKNLTKKRLAEIGKLGAAKRWKTKGEKKGGK